MTNDVRSVWGHQTVVTLQIRYVICYDIDMTLPKVFTRQNSEQQHTQGAWPHVNALGEQKEKDRRLIRAIPSVLMLEMSKGTRHTEQIQGPQVQDPDPCVGWDPHSLRALHLGSHDPWLGHQFLLVGPLRSGSLQPPGMVERSVRSVSSPHLPQRSLHPFSLLLCDFNCFYRCHDNAGHTTLILAGLVLSYPTEVLRKHTRCRAGRRGPGLFSAEQGQPTGRRS